jgi:hypothetical protein
MTSTHTPAPWHYETGDDGAVIYTGFTIAKIPIDGSNWQSNAHLIAAAPEILAALENLRGSIRHGATCRAPQAFPCSCDADQLWEMSGAAIAKATGGAL